ncbi:MAG: BlaI/MecI/CopY family transcriptional regulator [Candidatus Avoscillospira sp.]
MQTNLTQTEWAVLDCLWENAPQTLMQLVARLKETTGWAKSTTTTMVHRMEEKGLIVSEQSGKAKEFYPNVDQKEATARETRSFLDRVYKGSVGLMMSAMAEKQELSQDEIAQLYTILKEAEGKQP